MSNTDALVRSMIGDLRKCIRIVRFSVEMCERGNFFFFFKISLADCEVYCGNKSYDQIDASDD